MRLETFFEKFERFVEAPVAIPKLRELVLHLAAHGLLVDQRAGEGSAADLLSLSRQEMSRLMNTGQAKRERIAEPVLEHKQNFASPNGWAWCRLVDMGQFINGLAFKPADWVATGRPIVRIQNLSGRNTEFNRTERTVDASVLVQDGDILVSWSATLEAFIWRGEEAVLNQHIFRVLPAPAADKGFLYWLLKWAIRRLAESDHAHGLVMSHINRGPFLAQPIALPPLLEQKRIAAKVDELMALCDRLEAQQQERQTRHAALARASLACFAGAPTPANLDFLFHDAYSVEPADLRNSILTLAFQGKLVPQVPNDESGEALLTRIWHEGEFGGATSDHRRSVDLAELPYDLPAGWSTARLGDILQPHRGISYGVIKLGPEPKHDGVYVLRCSNVRFRRIDLSGVRKVTEQLSSEYSRTILKGGEVLINVRGTLGGCAVVPNALRGYNIAREVAVIPVHAEIDAAFVLNFIASPHFQDRVTENLRGIAYEGLNLSLLREFVLPVPPIAEQRRIVAKVNQLMGLVDQLEELLASAKTASAALLDAAIHELLSPTAEIAPFPSMPRSVLPDRAAIGCYTIQQLCDKRTFGRTAEVKLLYLAEAHLGVDLGGRYVRDAAGPLDQWIYKFEEEAARQQWFSVVESATKDGHKKIEYRKGPNLSAKAQEGALRLSAAQRGEFDRLLGLLAQRPTVEVEIIATLFAAWNDFLIDGHMPSDDEITQEVRENWHPSKQRFTQSELKTWLAWLRQHALVPQGKGPHTVGQQGKLQLH